MKVTRFAKSGICLFLLLIVLGAGIVPAVGAEAPAPSRERNVLILHSYHKGFEWTDEQSQGIEERLKAAAQPPALYEEYMDWKRYPSQDTLDRFRQTILQKYAKVPLSAVITTDDKALDFAIQYRTELFQDAPIIFSGINEIRADQIKQGQERITGVQEEIEPAETVELALKINPNLKNVYLLFDNSESGQSTGALARQRLEQLPAHLNIHAMNQLSAEEIRRTVAGLGEDSIVLMTTYYSDSTGRILEFGRFSAELAAASSVPVYHLYDFGLGHGAFGGSLLSGRMQGQKAAEIALRVIQGEDPDSIPVYKGSTARRVFDYKQMERFHISASDLPKGSEIINKPFSFYEEYQALVISLLAIFTLLLALIVLLLVYVRSIRAMRRKLEKSNERFSLATYGADAVIWELDMSAMNYYFSDRWYELLGYSKGELDEGRGGWRSIVHPEDAEQEDKQRREHLSGRTAYYYSEYRMRAKSGEYKWFQARGKLLRDDRGGFVRFAGSMVDITDRKGMESELQMSYQELESTYEELAALQDELLEQYNKVVENQTLLQASEEQYRELAYRDALSGLPNRLSLYEELAGMIEKAPGQPFTLYFMDIDNFKYINDSMGHSFGDELLHGVGERLEGLGWTGCRNYRLSGDEFVVVQERVGNLEEISAYAQELAAAFRAPFRLGESSAHLSVSIGIAQYPRNGERTDTLIMNADIAMYRAKETGKGKYVVYEEDMQREFDERVVIEKHLRNAIEGQELSLHYQPIQQLGAEGEVWGFEALLRWNSPALGFVSPLTFIRIAEDSRLIIPIGQWVLRRACDFMAGMVKKGLTDGRISVNLSVSQLLQEDFTENVLQTLEQSGLSPRHLELEITESIFMGSFDLIRSKLEYLRRTGIGIALDDFGTGYSSLSYLVQLPITTLKIDKSFIDGIPAEERTASLTSSIIAIGHDMGLSVTAEGVESEVQRRVLEETGCDKIQGYYLSRPLPESQVQAWLESFQNSKIDA
ncbi:EAL domain-containing protein [Paenibacillus spiritus]|uniref:EAL domain-containing protein n=1 Tax=Paenibacillus spiritus TaxID=2496557 RepID=A0A5J5GCA8_9BACL|nr:MULTISPECIES: ABC transporter substrate binding protein [Paenibacillus]KAA9005809.1 EAL domain-containing protein [Paenibacillus spiritus]